MIVSIDGTAVTSADDLQNLIQKDKAGQKIQITYYVGNSKRTTTVTLGTQAEAQQQESQVQGQPDQSVRGRRLHQPGQQQRERERLLNAPARAVVDVLGLLPLLLGWKASRHASSSLRAAARSSKPMTSVCFSGSRSL